jgi:hypothetical protein
MAKVNTLQAAQLTNKLAQAELGAVYVHGAAWVLQQPSGVTSTVPSALLARAETLLPPVTTQDSLLVVQATTNADTLAFLDRRAFSRQDTQERLKVSLAKAEAKSDSVFTSVAATAATWVKIKRWAWWIGGGFLGLFGLTLIMPALSIAFPAFAPFGAIIGNVVGAIIKIPFKLIPQAVKGAGMVAANVHEKTDDTVKALVLAIERAKADPKAAAVLKPHLLDATSKDWERPVIDAAKTALNLK